jgi:hypothetical protein
MVEPAPASPGQPIALGRASRGIRLGALDSSALQRRVEVVVPKCGTVGQAQCLHQIAAAQLVVSDDTDQGRCTKSRTLSMLSTIFPIYRRFDAGR